MQLSVYSIAAGLLIFSSSVMADETRVVPDTIVPPTLTVEQPKDPVASGPGGPLLLSISARLGPKILNVTSQTIIPYFHFVAPNGNAVLLRRDLVDTNGNDIRTNPSEPINVPVDAQKQGAVIAGGWTCNAGQYYVTQRAYILAADGSRSNAVQFTIHCNGG
jgi:hypothetical protein